MMPANAVHPNPQPPILFDPEGDVRTTLRLDRFSDEGRPMLNNYVRHVRVGGGQHGDVYLCHRINAHLLLGDPGRRIPVAMKSVKRNNPRAEQIKSLRKQRLPTSAHTTVADKLNTTEAKIRKEIAIMKKLRHPHVVRLYEVIDDRMTEKIYMVMEYLGGGEVKWRDDNRRPVLTVSQTRRILRDAVLGLEYLHHQGIIHRDIKPANLLWTDDRRQVKIADFGVSHFSYAQRLAAAGGKDVDEDPLDPLLLDDSDLTRRAGTPSFLAPEIIYEHTFDASDCRAASSSAVAPKRPEITKSIDIWALGVTLYCLLFGTIPFASQQGESVAGSEYSLYNAICNEDWPAPPAIGYDRMPSGGRHPNTKSEGASIINLLDRFLQKDYHVRITLDEVKYFVYQSQNNAWLLKDLDDPERWLQITSPKAKINVSTVETTDAMSVVHFRWRWGGRIARHVSSLFRGVRPLARAEVRNGAGEDSSVGSMSDPHPRSLNKKNTNGSAIVPSRPIGIPAKRDKGKVKAERANTLKRPDSKSSKSLRATSTERWMPATRGTSISTSALQGTVTPNSRRGTDTKNGDGGTSSPSSPTSVTTTRTVGEKRARFASLFQIANWRPNKYPSRSVAAVATEDYKQLQSTTRTFGMGTATPNTRRSEEAMRYYREEDVSEDGGNLTAARRASSWGQGDKEFTEMVSVQSVEHGLNEQEMNVGAGGVFHDALPVAGPSTYRGSSPLMPVMTHDLGSLEDEIARYGKPVYDDSSSIGSAVDIDDEGWQHGSGMDNNGDWQQGVDDAHGHWKDVDEFNHDDGESHLDIESDDDDDEEDNALTFSPRKHAQNE
ncbi:kinase-like domain-containing protein [Flammula alnicola]|nr:kinase-like domain-containing protein [Flammula alnicola]